MSLLALEVSVENNPALLDDDGDAYRRMARRYRSLVPMPGRKRSIVAMTVAAEEFGFELAELRTHNRKRPIALARQKAMAFAFVISKCSMREVARIAERTHSTAIRAIEKYQEEVQSALGGKNESRK